MIALLIALSVDVAFRWHHRRLRTFQCGRDHVITWPRPQRPDWMDQENYERMHKSIQVREVHVQVSQTGFRVRSLIIATTLTDAEGKRKGVRALKTSLFTYNDGAVTFSASGLIATASIPSVRSQSGRGDKGLRSWVAVAVNGAAAQPIERADSPPR
ncbi:MAG: hypothetical protein EXR98_13175 [Gemmataceae bacterium]|nr:hypothetical protein [Gemmataceae bacterium]